MTSVQESLINNVDQLIDLLERQLSLASKGRFSEVQALMSETQKLLAEINLQKTNDHPHMEEKKHTIKKLYEKLCLVVAGEKKHTFTELKKVRKGKKLINAYHQGM